MPKAGTFVKEAVQGFSPPSKGDRALAAGLGVVLALLLSGGLVQEAMAGRGAAGFGAADGAALAALLGLARLAWSRSLWRCWADPAFVVFWTLGAFAAVFLAVASTQHMGQVDGSLHFWLEDDAMVSMQFARHLASGDGLVWTRGQRVEGFSNPLWTLGMALPLLAGLPRALASAPVLLLNLFLALAAVWALMRFARALGARALPAALAAAGFGLSFELVWAAASGLETVAMACLGAWVFAGLAEARSARAAPPWWVLAGAAALALTRFDGVLPAGIVLALTWGLPSRRSRWLDAAFILGPLALWQVFRLDYYGAWVPNTVLLKSGDWSGRWLDGWRYCLRVDWESRVALVAALSALGRRDLRPWALALLLALAYAVTTGGDFYPGTRYIAWAWPLLWALAAAAMGAWLPPRWALAGMLAAVLSSYNALWAFPDLMRGARAEARQRIEIAEALGRRVAPGERVAAAWAGSFFYFSDVEGVDLLGKCDPAVARSPALTGLGGTAHNKLDLAHSLGALKPEWVLLVPPGGPGREAWLHSAFDRAVWDDPLFAAHCKGGAIAVGGAWALCHCRWSVGPQ